MKAKTFSILGDSISTFEQCNPGENEVFYPKEGCDVLVKEHTWWHLLIEETKLHLIINESYSGSRISRTGSRPPSSSFLSHTRQERLSGDIIIVFGGTNDFGQTENPATLAVFSEAYDHLVRLMLETHQGSKLFFCTPLQRLDKALDEKNIHLWSQNDLAMTIRKTVKRYPEANLIDLASYPITEGDGMLFDGLHPTRQGMRMIANLLKEGLELN
ncbi:MAG: SGNH/GDSL hydrolase family protein [Sphaerochaeta sp.]|nr:SGNH/GDSL hydrolase family protein [Sphaerochaeta sp.]